MKASNPLEGREVLLEFIPVGTYVRVTALDTKSLTEVAIQGPKNAPQSVLKNNALKRLEYVLRKNGVIT
ncbi:MAG: hypothetical protein EBQ96_02420 [Proteobacteria bacterium]|nr:hypothetical protein [Pseudomonadota bacterium]